MSDDNLYLYFRHLGTEETGVLLLMIFDRNTRSQINPNGAIYLTANGIEVGTVRSLSQLTYPQLARAGEVQPSAVIEVRYPDVKAILERRGLWPGSKGGIVRFECVDADGTLISPGAVFGLPVAISYPVPGESNIQRVGGRISPIGFLVSGAGWYNLVGDVVRRECGRVLPKEAAILDWGVGCGRIARYFLHAGYERLSGIDIDQYNVDWCRANLQGGDFSRCGFNPPTEFPADSFDLIYAHSVFTHLSLEDETAWLKELNRLLLPSGVGCVTVASEVGSYLIHNPVLKARPSHFSEYWHTGRVDLGSQAVGVDEGHPGYYRLVAHTRKYIEREWSHTVEIIRIIPGFADNQDAVVFRKR